MAVRWQILDTPPAWVTFDDDGYLTLVEVDSDGIYDIYFDRQGREWGPFRVNPGYQSWPINRGQNKRYEDIQAVLVDPLNKAIPVRVAEEVETAGEVN